MKRAKHSLRVILFGVLVLICLLCSCMKENDDVSESNINSNTISNIMINTENNDNIKLYSDQLYFEKTQGSSPSMVSSQSGYYLIGGAEGAKFLYYTDKATMKTTTLCNKPDCLHAEEKDPGKKRNCNAFLNDTADTVGDLIFYDNHLYCARGKLGIDQFTTVLTKISLDGTQREDVLVFKAFPQYIIIHRGYLYYSTMDDGTIAGKEDSTISKSGVYRVPMTNLKRVPELVYENDGIFAHIGVLAGYENCIYFVCIRYPDANLLKLDRELICYDIKSGKASIIDNNARRNAICGGKLVYSVDDGSKCVCDLDGANKRILDGVIGDADSDDKYLLTDTKAMYYQGVKDDQGNPIHKCLYVYDLNGKQLQAFDLESYQGASVLGSDMNYIFITSYSQSNKYEVECWKIDKGKIADGSATMEKYYSYKTYSGPQ